MFDYHNDVERKTVSLLVRCYRQLQASGTMPEADQKYFSGFVDAALMMDAYDALRLDDLVDQANREVFGMTLAERRRCRDFRTDAHILETPTYVRNQKISDSLGRKHRYQGQSDT